VVRVPSPAPATSNGRIFAAITKGKLMLKLPAGRVDELVADGTGEPFIMRGRAMREWILVAPERASAWPPLVDEAYRFVSAA
jgi:hypothetical protein